MWNSSGPTNKQSEPHVQPKNNNPMNSPQSVKSPVKASRIRSTTWVEGLSEVAKDAIEGMVIYCLDQEVCMGMNAGWVERTNRYGSPVRMRKQKWRIEIERAFNYPDATIRSGNRSLDYSVRKLWRVEMITPIREGGGYGYLGFSDNHTAAHAEIEVKFHVTDTDYAEAVKYFVKGWMDGELPCWAKEAISDLQIEPSQEI